MGTEVQSKMYLPGYYSIPTLTSNVDHGGWSLLHENKALKNGQEYDILSTRPVIEGFHECSKEQARQMILKHESIFKHQLNELHRLYKRQKDLMNEIKSKELLKHKKAAAASQLPVFSSGFPLVGSDYHRPSMSIAGISSQSYCSSIGNTQPTSGGPSQSGVKKLQRRLFNLELPADEYISDGEEPQGLLLGPATENCPPKTKNETKVSLNSNCEASGNNSGALCSGLYLERSYLTTLNEPIQTDQMFTSTNVYKGVWPFAKKFPENPQLVKDGGISNLLLKNASNQEEWLTANADHERTFGGSIGLPDFKKSCEPLTEARKASEPAKRTIFGIDISNVDLNSSADTSKCELPPTWARPPISLSNNWTSVQANSSFNASIHSNTASVVLQQKPEVTSDRLLLDCNSIPLIPALKGEPSHQNGVFFRTKFERNKINSHQPSIRLDFSYAESSSRNSASEEFTQQGPQWHYSRVGCTADAKPSTNVHDDTFLNRLRNQETPQGRLHWLEAASLCNGPLASVVDNDNAVKVGFVKGDTFHDPTPQICLQQLKTQNEKAYSAHQIDLNRCLTEEETQEVNVGEASEERKCIEHFDSSLDVLITVAAEALVSISSSQANAMQKNAAHGLDQEKCAGPEGNATEIDNSLLWFAEIASSEKQNLEQSDDVIKVQGASCSACDKDSSLDSTDYFEYMTLNLAETKLDQCCNVPSDNRKEEVPQSRRPQRGQMRRGMQKKDFQRDVLPGIACLSRNEVSEDLQTFEGSIRASDGSWQSGISPRNAGKVGGGRGRKRLGTCTLAPTSTTEAEVSQIQMQQPPQCEQLQEVEEKSVAVTGWGKRTRRPPRQRYPINSSPVSKK